MDATLASLALFDQPDHWDRIDEDVPIFVPHETRDQAGKPLKVNLGRLHQIAAKINELYETRGCPIKFTEGHTRDPRTVPQPLQPAILAYGVGAHVGSWGPKGLPAVLVRRVFYRKGMFERAKELPERSPEFYPDTNEIKIVAMLKTDPRLNMGMMICSRSDGAVLYQRGVKYMAEQVEDPTQLPPNKDAPEPGQEVDGPIPEEEKQKFMKYMAACYPHLHAMHMGMTPAMPSATNGAIPTPTAPPATKQEDVGGPDEPRERDDMSKNAMSIHYERLKKEAEAELAASRKERLTLQAERRAIAYEKDLRHLQDLGYSFNLAEELKDCLPLESAAFEAHKARIARNYQRDPAKMPRVPIDPTPPLGANQDDELTEPQLELAQQYMQDHHTDNKLGYDAFWAKAEAYARDPKNRHLLNRSR